LRASAPFAPDGKSIAIAEGPVGGDGDVWAMRLDRTGLERVTRSAQSESAPDRGRG
jgi:hypothetical protein